MRKIKDQDSAAIHRCLVGPSFFVHQGKMFCSCDENESNICTTNFLKEVLTQADFTRNQTKRKVCYAYSVIHKL